MMNNFEKMMNMMAKMEQMMAMMEKFEAMMGGSEEPQVAPAEVAKVTKQSPAMSREDFLALGEEVPLYGEKKSSKKTSAKVDLGVLPNGLVVFNGFLPGDAWWYNHHKMIVDYKAKSIKRGGTWGYTFESLADRNACLSQFSVKQLAELTAEDHHNCKVWREDKSWMKK